MLRWALFITLFAAGACALGATTQPADTSVGELIGRLSSDNWATRHMAERSLIAMGNAAEPVLRQALSKPLDAETRLRIQQALEQIHSNRLTGPSLITLDYDKADLKTVVQDLVRQAHAQIELAAAGMPSTVSIHVHQQPFWVAMKKLCDQTGLSPQFGVDNQLKLVRMGGDYLNGVADCQGAFVVVARKLTENSELSLGQGKAIRQTLRLEMAVLAEPKMMLLGHQYLPSIDEAVDDLGNSMVSEQRVNNPLNINNGSVWSALINLRRPDRNARRIARLKGSLKAIIQTGAETWNVPNILKVHDLNHDFGDCTYSINSVTPMGSMYVLRVSGVRLSASEGGNYLGIGEVQLLDDQGKALTKRGGGGGGGTADHMVYTMTFDSNDGNHHTGKPYRLVWKVPTSSRLVEVPFEFKDLPLP